MNLTTALASRLLVPTLLAAVLAAPTTLRAQRAPNVDVWFDRGNEFDRGEPGRIMYSGDAGSYVTLLRVDTDGRLSVLAPRNPNDRSRFDGSRNGIAVPFQADPAQGVGYVFAVASRSPFDFRNYRGRGNTWDPGRLGERGMVDPFEIVDRFARSSVGARGDYSIAYAPYEIGRGGAGRASYQSGARYVEGYGRDGGYGYSGGYDDPWGASPYRRGYDNYEYRADYSRRDAYAGRYGGNGGRNDSQYIQDPRTHYLRHCPDGTLAPYTTQCRAFAPQPGRDGGTTNQLREPMPRQSPRHPPPMQRDPGSVR